MKKYLNFAFVLFAGLSVVLSCSKIEKEIDNPVVKPGNEAVVSVPVTITATLPDADTKVAFEATFEDTSFKPTAMKRTWEDGDKLRVIDSTNPSMYEDLDLESGDGTPTAVFHGNLKFTASSYNVEVVEAQAHTTSYGVQTQAANGDTNHLQFVASATGVTDLTAAIPLNEISGVLGIIAKLPASATDIESVDIVKISDNSTVLKINLTDPAVGSDQVLKLFANMQAGVTIDAGEYFIRFNAPSSAEHKIYTRYYELANPVAFATHTGGVGEYRTLKLNCVNTDKYAGGSDKGTSTAPYLIADGYQLAAINSYASTSETTYFKMIDNIDMTGITHTLINEGVTDYAINVNFDGNNKTISNLSKSLFYVFKGSIKDLTLDNSNVTNRGIFADYCQGAGHSITNVTVSNGTVTSTSSNVGGLIGNINGSGTSATITNCTVTNTNVSGAGVVGGMIGFADALVTISGCSYSGGEVSATSRFAGGLIASTGNYSSVISDCHVEDATIKVAITNNDYRSGGFIGQQQTNVTIKGCYAGTSSKPVTLDLAAPASGKVYNAGGFVGVQYGTITKNGDTRNSSYVTIISANTGGTTQLNIGGFVAYNQGITEYSDAYVSSTSITGSHIGGFAGIVINGAINNCTASGTLAGTQKTGGFAGVAQTGSITSCSASTVISKVGTTSGTGNGCDFGGFVGEITQNATLTKCYSDADVSINASYVGGFAGSVNTSSTKTSTISKCWSTGKVTSSSSQCGAFIGHIAANDEGTVNVSDCYVTGNLVETNQRQGGLVGQINSGVVTISRCYASGTVAGSFATGGLIGFMNATATVQDCAAWNSSVTPKSYGDGNWSSGAVIGVAWPIATLSNNYRKPGMSLTAWWVPDADYNHPDVSSASALVVKDKTNGTLRATTATSAASGQDNYPQFAYHGKVDATKTLSQLASTTLGWSDTVWDFSADLPTLK